MNGKRSVVVLVVVAVVAALTVWWPGSGPVSTTAAVGQGMPAGGDPGALSSTWYCAAGTWGRDGSPRHRLRLVDPAGIGGSVSVSAFDAEGPVGEERLTLDGSSPVVVELSELFDGAEGLSVMVESDAGGLVVEHTLSGGDGVDLAPCSPSASDRWYFPAQTTLLATTAQLVLFNPFASDAAVDVSVAVEEGVRVPGEWQGIVVPAGTVRTLNLGAEGEEFGIQRRDQFAVSVSLRTGRVVAETVQTLATEDPQTSGVRLQPGVPRAANAWSFAQGFVDPGLDARLVVYNPGDAGASVAVQVTPYGGAADPPEPFELEVPARRYQYVDLSSETRIPPGVPHSITVESVGSPVVVARVISVLDEPAADAGDDGDAADEDDVVGSAVGRPAVDGGTSIGTGSPVAAQRWMALVRADLEDASRQGDGFVTVHNPGDDDAVVSMTVFGDEVSGVVALDGAELRPGEGLATPITIESGERWVSVIVESSVPVVVERTVAFAAQPDATMTLAVPLRSGGSIVSVAGA